jgi:hypothetical protein
MKRKGDMRDEIRRMKGRRGEVEISSVTILTGKTPDSAVMTTRAGKYH